MKRKGLLFLPLASVVFLSGCDLLNSLPGMDKVNGLLSKLPIIGGLFDKGETGGGGGGGGIDIDDGTGGGGGGGVDDGGGSVVVDGTALATITMTKCQDMTSEGVFEKNGYKVTVTQGSCNQTVAQAVSATGNYEFRVYAKMDVTFTGPSAFKKLLITYSTYTAEGKTYYFDYTELEGATNTFDNSAAKAVVTLNSPSTSFTVNCWHQTRIASVAFYA